MPDARAHQRLGSPSAHAAHAEKDDAGVLKAHESVLPDELYGPFKGFHPQ